MHPYLSSQNTTPRALKKGKKVISTNFRLKGKDLLNQTQSDNELLSRATKSDTKKPLTNVCILGEINFSIQSHG